MYPTGAELNVQCGDVLHATIDAHHSVRLADGSEDIKRAFTLAVWRDGTSVFCSTFRGIQGNGEPLALAVALKYANDGVKLRRLRVAEESRWREDEME